MTAVVDLGVQDLQDLKLRFIIYHNWWRGRLDSIRKRIQDSWLQHGDVEDRVYSVKTVRKSQGDRMGAGLGNNFIRWKEFL